MLFTCFLWLAKLSFFLSGIHCDIAEEKQEYWSSFAPLSLEVVLSIGQKARDGALSGQVPYQKLFCEDVVSSISCSVTLQVL